jgi:uncharacterized protein involved in exopolysaccharide biosynthesis
VTSIHPFDASEESESGGMLASIPSILLQRWPLLAVPIILCTIIALLVGLVLPRTYVARAVLMVEGSELPNELGNPTANDVIDRRLSKVRQQILSRPSLVELINANNLYDAKARGGATSGMVDQLRKATHIDALNADIMPSNSGGNRASSIAFALSFEYPEPIKAKAITQAYVDGLINLDASQSVNDANNAERVLQDQETGLKSQIAAIEGQINQLTRENGFTLATAGSAGGGSAGGYDAQIASLQRDNAQLVAQMSAGSAGRDPEVAAAEAQLAAARANYSDDHPDVKLAENRLAAIRRMATARSRGRGGAMFTQQIATNNAIISGLREARAREESRANAMMAAQSQAPGVMQQIAQLQARLELLNSQLGRITGSLMNARSMTKLASERRTDRLTLIEAPVLPDSPTLSSKKLLAAGIAAGAGIGLVLILLTELILRPIRGANALVRLFGAPPLVVIPIMYRDKKPRHWWSSWEWLRPAARH